MKGFEEIQQLWHGQAPDSNVSFETVLKRVKSSRSALARKLFWQSISMGIAVAILIWICLTVDFSTWTTYLAIAIMVGCIGYYFASQLSDYRAIHNSQDLLSKPQDYIHYLKTFQQKRYRFNTRNYTIYEACIGVAFALYGIEMYFALSLWTFIGLVVFVIFWFVVCHVVFMKQYIRNEHARLAEMIDNLERIKGQFNESAR
ncbi:hypothetical protein [Parapedobacter sp. 10938]|uniref:hypothetical protein n=1 Tax=Parapedobacter flavus TaxID=3110225 RepID=UPI002DB6CF7C|nr:hypothetical protein [Parapedobacter sp. 10938]MEC3878270.1 hypothetical protein [Parapedobacter sp. 10938]